MRVLFVTYDHPLQGRSGVSMYCRDLLRALTQREIEVGVVHVHRRDWRLRPRVHVSRASGVTLFALVNSPLDPEESIRRPDQDCRHPGVDRLMRACIRQYRPDIVHVQTLQGYPGSIAAVAGDLGVPLVVTLHDFWAICPRLGLMRLDGTTCDGPDGGRNCVQFCVRPRLLRERMYRMGDRIPDGRLRRAFQAVRALYHRATAHTGSLWTPRPNGMGRPDKQALAGQARRVASLLRVLHHAEAVLAVSEYVRTCFIRHGVAPLSIRTLPPALALEGIEWRHRQAGIAPLRVGYLGRVVPMKGAHVAALAARDVDPAHARFLFFGGVSPESRRYLQTLAGEGRLEFRGPYTRHELPRILDEVDVVVVPSVMQETVGLVALEAQAAGVPVIASRAGAIPEHITDGDNGLLFAPGDPSDLRRAIMRCVEAPALVAAMSARTRRAVPIGAHVDALLDVYVTASRGRCVAWTPS